MAYIFGKENTVRAGYRNFLLLNEDPTIDDRTIHQPFVYYIPVVRREERNGNLL